MITQIKAVRNKKRRTPTLNAENPKEKKSTYITACDSKLNFDKKCSSIRRDSCPQRSRNKNAMKITLDDDKIQEERAVYDAEREAIKKTFKGEKKKLSKMRLSEKLKYIRSYYKIPVIAAVIGIIAAAYLLSVIINRKETVLMGVVINDPAVRAHEYQAFLDRQLDLPAKQQTELVTDVSLSNVTTPYMSGKSMSGSSQIMVYILGHELDYVITDKTGLEYLCAEDVSRHLDEFLPEYIYDAFGEKIISMDVKGSMIPVAIDITKSRFAESLGLSYSPAYICFQDLSGHDDNMQRFLELLYKFEFTDTSLSF